MKEVLKNHFLSPPPLDLHEKLQRHACVAVILRGASFDTMELAFIQRAYNPTDRWSGHIAFPGGKREESDLTDLAAALRETQEEVGLELSNVELVGRLDDVQARKAGTMLDFYIRPFVFHIDRTFGVTLDASEVADFFWIPIKDIQSPQRQTFYEVSRDTGGIKLPAVYLDRDPPLWGLTYMMVLNLFDRLKINAAKSSTVKNL